MKMPSRYTARIPRVKSSRPRSSAIRKTLVKAFRATKESPSRQKQQRPSTGSPMRGAGTYPMMVVVATGARCFSGLRLGGRLLGLRALAAVGAGEPVGLVGDQAELFGGAPDLG